LSVTILFAAGTSSGTLRDAWNQTARYLGQLSPTVSRTLLNAWLEAAARRFDSVRELLGQLPRHILETDANVAALRMVVGDELEDAFAGVISWAGCKKVLTLLDAVGRFTQSESVAGRLAEARAAAELKAGALAEEWPAEGIDAGDEAAPQWANLLVRIASRQLMAGNAAAAAAIYEVAVEQSASNPTLVNNWGFCLMPLDVTAALETLSRAANLYARPFGVNVANRMLAYVVLGEGHRALELGESYYRLGPTERGGAWLWDIDDPKVLNSDVDILDYILRLASKAAWHVGRDDLYELWERRLAMRETKAGTEHEESE
jgi:tetratricopeptide (TPR) repeat protein